MVKSDQQLLHNAGRGVWTVSSKFMLLFSMSLPVIKQYSYLHEGLAPFSSTYGIVQITSEWVFQQTAAELSQKHSFHCIPGRWSGALSMMKYGRDKQKPKKNFKSS